MWAFAGAVLSAAGIIHAYSLTPRGVENQFGWLAAPGFVTGYALTGCLLVALHFCRRPAANQTPEARASHVRANQ
jgi:adenine/guanine/hypoxanthine permease